MPQGARATAEGRGAGASPALGDELCHALVLLRALLRHRPAMRAQRARWGRSPRSPHPVPPPGGRATAAPAVGAGVGAKGAAAAGPWQDPSPYT